MKKCAVLGEPILILGNVRHQGLDQPPETRLMIELPQMRDFVRNDVVEDAWRRQDEPPRERQAARRGARAPAARSIADGNALGRNPERKRVFGNAIFDPLSPLPPPPTHHSPLNMLLP